MYHAGAHVSPPQLQSASPRPEAATATLADLALGWQARWRWIALWTAVCLALALAFVETAPVEFEASSQILLSPLALHANGGELPGNLDATEIESRVQMVQSEVILRHAFEILGLESADAKLELDQSLLARTVATVRSLIGQQGDKDPVKEKVRRKYAAFAERVSSRRIGQSRVLDISFYAPNSKLAVRAANAVALSFIRDEITNTQSGDTGQGEWLRARIDQYRTDIARLDQVAGADAESFSAPSAPTARIISFAHEPAAKAFPKTGIILAFGIAFGLLTGLAGAAVAGGFDDRILSLGSIRRRFGDILVLQTPRSIGKDGAETLPSSRLAARSAAAYAMSALTRRGQAFGVASTDTCRERERLALQIAQAFSSDGRKVTLFKIASAAGPARTKDSGESLRRIVAPVEGEGASPRIYKIGAPTEPHVRGLIESARVDDTIIVDLPALQTFPEGQVLLRDFDGVFLAVRLNETRMSALSAMIERFMHVGIPVVAIVAFGK